MAGSVFGVFTWPEDPLKIVVVPNIKRDVWQAEFRKLADQILVENNEQEGNFRDWKTFQKYVSLELEKRGIRVSHIAKKNKLGLPGGEIHQFELDNYPKHLAYAAFAIAREYSEETRLIISRPILDEFGKQKVDEDGYPASEDLFEHVLMLPSPDHNDKTRVYENHFFLVRGVFGDLVLNPDGVVEETGAAELYDITELTLSMCYPKHTYGVAACLEKLIEEGRTEYIGALNHLKAEFGGAWNKMLAAYKKAAQQDKLAMRSQTKAAEPVPESWEELAQSVKPLHR